MKHSFIAGAILLLAPAVAQAQFQSPPVAEPPTSIPAAPPTLIPAAPRADTPALDAFAGIGRPLQMQLRWVQIDGGVLTKNLPAWDKLDNSSHVATPDELKRLELLELTRSATISERQLDALNNQTTDFSFFPFLSFNLPISKPEPIDEMNILRDKSIFDSAAKPYIPNLAKPESRLPAMAPMPGTGSQFGRRLVEPLGGSRPQTAPAMEELLSYKFQIRPTIVGDQIALALNSESEVNNFPGSAQAKIGETVVFSIPNITMITQERTSSRINFHRTILLVTPRIAPEKPRDLR